MASFIIAIIALVVAVMATMTIPQALWGRPRIRPQFSYHDSKEAGFLSVQIWNLPVTFPIIRNMVDRSTAEDVSATYEVFEAGTNKQVCLPTFAILQNLANQSGKLLNIPASGKYAVFDIVVANYDTGIVRILQPTTKAITLNEGDYQIAVGIDYRNHIIKARAEINVREQYPFCEWDNSSFEWKKQ